jgi:hypothetical protein
MSPYDVGEAVLRGGPRWLARAAVLALLVGFSTNAAWSTALVTGYVEHRADAVESVQQSFERAFPTPAPATPPRVG